MKQTEKCQGIQLVVADVDGVLTDGGIIYDNQAIELKAFHIRDGLGIRLWQRAGGRFAIVTGRNSHIVEVRATELGVQIIRQGVEEKLRVVREIADELGLDAQQIGYIGDDLPDLPAVRYAGFGVAVSDACKELREAADYVTTLPGGRGAVRETIQTILEAQGRWNDLVKSYNG